MASYNIYPAVDQQFNFPPQIRQAMARSSEFSGQIVNEVASKIADAAIVTEATKTAVTKELAYRNVPVVLTERLVSEDRPMTDGYTKGLWRFENDLIDSSSNKKDLDLRSGTLSFSASSAKFGNYGLATGRVGSDTADSFALEGSLLPDMTIEAWIKTTASGKIQVIAGRGNSTWIGMTADGLLQAAYDKEGGGTGTFFTTVKINDGQWHHVALAVRKGNGGTVYCDGNMASNNTTVPGWRKAPIAGNTTFFAIGGLGSSNFPYPWEGSIDEVRLSNVTRTYERSYGIRPDVPGGLVTYVGLTEPADMLAGDTWRKVSV